MSSSSNNKTVLDQHEDSDWKELPQWIREAASVLGYTKKLWDKDREPSTCQKDWSDLSIPEQKAATSLGYNANLWDSDTSSDTSGESDDDGEELSPETTTTTMKNLYCIQIYTETNDYRLQIREGMGISMHANRIMEKDEIIMKSPTGPSNHKTLLQASSSSSLSPERTAFAERFVEWQKSYGRTDRPGASGSGFGSSFTFDDFLHVPDHRIEDHILPTEMNPSYHMQLYENDVVIVEFISPNYSDSGDNTSSSSSLPPERRFEILDFGEALVEDCEEDYNPKIMKRPTSLCGCEARSLEVPGHFHNHACGSSATAYDTVRLADDCSSACPLVAPAQPSWVQKELQSKCEYPAHIPNAMTTHRALAPGDEITSDYILWHWSNDDYIPNSPVNVTPEGFFGEWDWEELPPKIVKAAKALGYTQTIWEEDRGDPSAFEKYWKELTSEEREAAKALGYTDNSWNETEEEESPSPSPSPSPAIVSHHEDDNPIYDMDWSELEDEQRKAALALGYNEVDWGAVEDNPFEDLYWYQLTPEQQTSAATIGYNQLSWDSIGAEEPWFYCRCGDDKCQSADGFRGLKYLPIEEQKRLYWVVEPYVRHQIDWNLYQLEQEKEDI